LGNGNRPCVEAIKTWDQVLRYTSKYLGKPDWEGGFMDRPPKKKKRK
jgi:hypothetical protein